MAHQREKWLQDACLHVHKQIGILRRVEKGGGYAEHCIAQVLNLREKQGKVEVYTCRCQ